MTLDVRNHEGLRPEIVYGDVEETLDLAGVKVHGDDMVAAGDDEHVGDELGGDGRTTLVLLVHACIGEARNDGRYAARRGSLTGRDEDEKFH